MYTFGLVAGVAVCLEFYVLDRWFALHHLRVNTWALCGTLLCAGVIGARLDAILVHAIRHDDLRNAGTKMLAVDGGYTYLGAVLAALLAALVFRRVYQLPWRSFDATFCVGLGYAIGRIGCFLAGDGDYGRPTSLPWGMSFPHGSVPTSLRVHPTMLYSSAWEFLIFFLLWRLSNHVRRPPLRAGTIFCVYVLSSSVGRFLIEFLSRNPVLALGLKEAQWVSLALVAFATVLLIAIYLQKPRPEPD